MILSAIIFIVAGILIKYFKMYFLIAGYNTKSKKEKAKYDIKSIAHIFGVTLIIMGILIFVGWFIGDLTHTPLVAQITFYVSLLIGIPFILIKVNSKKYKV